MIKSSDPTADPTSKNELSTSNVDKYANNIVVFDEIEQNLSDYSRSLLGAYLYDDKEMKQFINQWKKDMFVIYGKITELIRKLHKNTANPLFYPQSPFANL